MSDRERGGAHDGRVGLGPESVPFAALEPEEASESDFTCALCGARFGHGHLACSGCPLAAGCEIVRCPNCGYQFPRSSAIVDRLARWAKRLKEWP